MDDRDNNLEILKKEALFQDSKVMDEVRADFFTFYRDNKEADAYFNESIAGLTGSLLVLGCGDTDITLFAEKGFSDINGIDISPKSIEKINKIITKKGLEKKVKAMVMDAHNLEFSNKNFDAIVGRSIIHHLDIEKISQELARVLKPGGKIVFLEPLGSNPIVNLYRLLTPRARTEDEHPLTLIDFKIIKKYFETVEIKGFYIFTIISFGFRAIIKSDRLYKFSRSILIKIDYLFLKIFPFLKYFCWITVFKGIKK